jgi:hypothetical protein
VDQNAHLIQWPQLVLVRQLATVAGGVDQQYPIAPLLRPLVGFVVPLVAESFEKHQRQDVGLVILTGGPTAKDIGGAPQVGFELLLRQAGHRGFCSDRRVGQYGS